MELGEEGHDLLETLYLLELKVDVLCLSIITKLFLEEIHSVIIALFIFIINPNLSYRYHNPMRVFVSSLSRMCLW